MVMSARGLAVAALVAAAVATSGALAGPSGTGTTLGGVVMLDAEEEEGTEEEVQVQTDIAYGLHEVDCPKDVTQDQSAEGTVTLDSIKDMIGCDKDDELKFVWVYPVSKATLVKLKPTTAAEEGFELFGGYKYSWNDTATETEKEKCFALGTGNTLTLSHTEPVPKTKDWHKVTIKGLNYSQFAWVPPDDEVCTHGCFVYKNMLGKTAAMKVGAGRKQR
mmetsp:Transcript_20878/g.58594  ORF Transcript_20878/g.58594 Transcript_20878/m.58594 type:complete len:219 (+) Transcript_20878:91-747(+)